MATALVLPAAGQGERLGAGVPKALVELAGVPLLVHAVRAAAVSGCVDHLIVAAPADQVANVRALLAAPAETPSDRVPSVAGSATDCTRSLGDLPLIVVAGGESRRQSVSAALAALPSDVDIVLVHDAARCLTPPHLFADVAKAVAGGAPAVVPVMPLSDTIKQVTGELITHTPDRSALRAVQTPQGFARDVLVAAHAATADDATDDAGLVERLGYPVTTVPGHQEAFKITTALDLDLAQAVLRRRESS